MRSKHRVLVALAMTVGTATQLVTNVTGLVNATTVSTTLASAGTSTVPGTSWSTENVTELLSSTVVEVVTNLTTHVPRTTTHVLCPTTHASHKNRTAISNGTHTLDVPHAGSSGVYVYPREYCNCRCTLTDDQVVSVMAAVLVCGMIIATGLNYLLGNPLDPNTWDWVVTYLWPRLPCGMGSALYRAYVRVRSRSNYDQDLPENLLAPDGSDWQVQLELDPGDDPDEIVPIPEPGPSGRRWGRRPAVFESQREADIGEDETHGDSECVVIVHDF